ncbi:50S ribosomal protein L23 [Candidatus Protochlamydia naegleriophila]|uniref:Large ribosomal subunit protein uL23 n=1 Tax=Candidatus Protochlamydia naegleriophila TaxID=389348 RepID=A0A0U5JFF6_9BACT|nr:50S ribosomal protein L23 [Candidatus Protochlamydia naegleriophila]CUI17562.1 50S ribosomal protein L23 [Candidatus Protochlamydia naegleriophila]
MTKKSPYQVVKHQYVTEKSIVLQQLKTAESNPSVKRCESPKYVFIVDRSANKEEIAQAVEEIYKNENVKVMAVNTINVKAKARRVRGRAGFKNAFKKAIVTLRAGDSLDNV